MKVNAGTRWTGAGSADPGEGTSDGGRRSRRGFLGAVATAALGASAGCVTFESTSATETRELDADGPLTVENTHGDLSVQGGDVDSVVAELTKHDDFGNEDALAKVSLQSDRSGEGVSVSVADETEGGLVQATTADLSVTVPDSVEVSEVIGDDGTLTVERISGDVDVTVDDGDGEIAEVDGDLTLSVDDGDMTASDVGGAVEVTADDGDVVVDGAQGPVAVESDDGDVTVTDAGGVGRIQADDGDVELDVRGIEPDGTVVVDDGDVEARLASSVEGTVVATTDNGDVSTEGLSADVSVSADGDRVEADLGGADQRLRVESDDGDITLASLD